MIILGITEHATDHMTLYDAWYAAALLVAMCVRVDRGGVFKNLGAYPIQSNARNAVGKVDVYGVGAQRKIRVVIDDGSDPLQLANGAALATNVGGARTILTPEGKWDAVWDGSMAVS